MKSIASFLISATLSAFVAGSALANPAAAPAAGTVDAAQMEKLGIRLEAAQQVDNLPIGTVPGLIALSPDGRVAVTVPYGGVMVRLLVIEGQPVRRGARLRRARSRHQSRIWRRAT